jgi:microcin C transport system substrate-binding protein
MLRRALAAVFVTAFSLCVLGDSAQAIVRGKPVHGLALYGEPKYGPDFKNFDYANPNAPKGGTFVKSNEAYLTFDTFNPYTVKGASVQGLELLLYDTLMTPSQDEPASVYGLIAETAEVATDNSWVEFSIRPTARFTDGNPITADDVVFSFDTFVAKATPRYRAMYADVAKVEALGANTVRFSFKTPDNRKLPFLIAKYLPVLSEAFWKDRDFTNTILDVPVTTGPYLIESFEPGKFIIYRRWENYWGKDLPVNRGLYNFERVRFDYYRDDDVQFEAFKTGNYDFKREVRARRWAIGYDFPAALEGKVKKINVKDIQPASVQPVYLNLRRPMFQDRRVREALNYAFDFESLNKSLFYEQYVRSRSYWQGSPLEASGLPSAAELELLEPYRDKVPPEVFTSAFNQPATAGNGDVRENLLKARDLLTQAGWELRDGKLTNEKTGEPFAFEFLLNQQGTEAVFLPFTQNLQRLGIEANLRVVDTSQYVNRVNNFDFDATFIVFPHNDLTPGNEQVDNWGSQAADAPGSNNASGVKDPVVDALISKIVGAESYDDVIAATRALDRVLTWNFYQVLTYTSPTERYAYWSKLQVPEITPALGWGEMGEFSNGMGESVIALWWMDPAAAQTAGAPAAATAIDATLPEPSSRGLWLILALAIVGASVVVFFIRRRKSE